MIIDHTYFIVKINLPQTGTTDGQANVNGFIETYEPEYLQKVLGYDLWKAFTDGIAGSGEPDQRWKDLLEGKAFAYNGKNSAWPGFEAKPSPISQYVYYQLQEDGAEDSVLVGTSTGATDNATRVSPEPKMISAWNEMVRLNVLLWNFLYANKTVYPEWKQEGYPYGWYGLNGCMIGNYYIEHGNQLYNLKNYHGL